MKDTIIPFAFVIGTFVAILVIASVWIYTGKGQNNTMNDTQKAENLGMNDVSLNGESSATGDLVEVTPGLQMRDITVGTGAAVAAGQTVSVKYTGKLADGTVFDSSEAHGGDPFVFGLGAGQVIKGWDIGVVGMQPGGVRELVIAPELAYGDREIGGVIPANSTLTFMVEMIGPVQ